jgi:vanillate O-demethylase ferredoxin subunit
VNAPLPLNVAAQAEAEGAGGTLQLQLRAIRWEAEGVHSFELAPTSGAPLPAVQAGAHVDVQLPGGLLRQYSLAGDPADRSHWFLGVLREAAGRGGSRAMHDSLRVGDVVQVSAPRNAFALAPEATHSILLAGGIGITPLKAMAHQLARDGRSFELHLCARTPRHAAFFDTLRSVVSAGCLHLHCDGGNPARGLGIGGLLQEQSPGTHVYFCGPPGFMQACSAATAHWQPGTVHSEHFKAPEPATPPMPAGSFEVLLSRRGVRVQVQPAQSIVQALEVAGVIVPTSCQAGLCGSCKTSYTAGEVEHNDYILSDDDHRHCMTPCVSRARSPLLVLDL